jgi:hypothetical protein
MGVKLQLSHYGKSTDQAFENVVLQRKFRHKMDKVPGGCRKLYNAVVHNLYSIPRIVKIIKGRAGQGMQFLENSAPWS